MREWLLLTPSTKCLFLIFKSFRKLESLYWSGRRVSVPKGLSGFIRTEENQSPIQGTVKSGSDESAKRKAPEFEFQISLPSVSSSDDRCAISFVCST